MYVCYKPSARNAGHILYACYAFYPCLTPSNPLLLDGPNPFGGGGHAAGSRDHILIYMVLPGGDDDHPPSTFGGGRRTGQGTIYREIYIYTAGIEW